MRTPRGVTLIEVMIAGAVLLIAVTGLGVTVTNAAGANATAHRRTVAAFARRELLERIAVTPRDRLALLAPGEWIIHGCFGRDAQRLAANDAGTTVFACPAATVYRTWLRVVTLAAPRTWRVETYAERLPGCAPADRFRRTDCVAADILLTD